MKIREIQGKDLLAWSRLRKQLWQQVTDEENREELDHVLNNRNNFQIFLAENEAGEIVGFLEAGLRRDYVEGCETSPVGYIEGWFVAEDFRRQSVGRLLVEASENWARSLGCQEMASDCLLENEISLAAHLAVGFNEAERIIHFKKNL